MNPPIVKPAVEHFSGINVFDLLSARPEASRLQSLRIPDYQRGYCWSKKQVEALLESLWYFDWRGGRTLHLGTVVVHENEEAGSVFWDIVDGQQRLITLAILLVKLAPKTVAPLLASESADDEALKHIRWASMTVGEWIKNHSDTTGADCIPFSQITFDVVVIKGSENLQLAYTFFNAVNSAGKKLSDYDLLKSHHLRFLEKNDPQEYLASGWDALSQKKIHSFGGEEALLVEETLDASLYRLRRWIRNRSIQNERGHVFEHYSAYENIIGKAGSTGPLSYDAGIVGGTWFFGYARKYANAFERFAQTEAVRRLYEFPDAWRHARLLHVIRALLFLYYCKFCLDGETYLNDALLFIVQRIGRIRNRFKITETIFQDPLVLHTVEALDESPAPEHFFRYCVLPTNLYARDYGTSRGNVAYTATSPHGVRPAFWQGAYALYEKLKPGMVEWWFNPETTFVRDFLRNQDNNN